MLMSSYIDATVYTHYCSELHCITSPCCINSYSSWASLLFIWEFLRERSEETCKSFIVLSRRAVAVTQRPNISHCDACSLFDRPPGCSLMIPGPVVRCRKMLKLCGETQDRLAQELILFELTIERDIVEPLYDLAEVQKPLWDYLWSDVLGFASILWTSPIDKKHDAI